MTQTPPQRDDDRIDECLDAELLSSYLDGRTTPAERAVVEAHLAQCEDCYFAFAETIQGGRQLDTKTRDGRRWILGGATAVAAAAGLVVAVALGTTYQSAAPTTLTIALHELDAAAGLYRRVEARVTVLPTHRALQPVMRSTSASSETSPALREASAIVEKAAGGRADAEGRHALGAMYLRRVRRRERPRS